MDDTDELTALRSRLTQLEADARRTRRGILVAGAVGLVGALNAAHRSTPPEVMTVRGLIVVDSAGRSRISIGEMPGSRRSRSFGMAIRDSAGDERFGVALAADGQMGMGFDAPRGTGSEANRERINISTGQNGLASIRFSDRKTTPRAYLMLADDDRVSLVLNADTAGRRTYRMYSALHDTAASGPIP